MLSTFSHVDWPSVGLLWRTIYSSPLLIFGYSGSLTFPYEIEGQLGNFGKKRHLHCDRDCTGLEMGLQSHMILWEIWGNLEKLSPVMS